MKQIAYLTMDSLDGYVAYDAQTVAPLAARGWEITWIPWRQDAVDWKQFDLVVIRSTWDYQKDPGAFLRRLAEIEAAGTPLANRLAIARWNLDKHYLRDLQHRGVTIVPTYWAAPSAVPMEIDHLRNTLGTDSLVVKPTVGAGAEGAYRLGPDASGDLIQALQTDYIDRPFMAQPFVPSVVETGEFSLFYFGDRYSHAIVKRPKAGDFRVQEEHGGQIESIQPSVDLRDAAASALHAVAEPLLYARVDLVRLPDGTPALIELELVEPSLYFPYDADSPERFADAVERWHQRLH